MIKQLLLSAAMLVLAAFGAASQTHINNTISKIEKGNRASDVIYSENRNPNTHQLVKSSKVLVINRQDAAAVAQAIERDREKSVAYERVGNNVYTVKFIDAKMQSVYTLLRQRDGSWMLTVECRPRIQSKVKKQKQKKVKPVTYVFDEEYGTGWITI